MFHGKLLHCLPKWLLCFVFLPSMNGSFCCMYLDVLCQCFGFCVVIYCGYLYWLTKDDWNIFLYYFMPFFYFLGWVICWGLWPIFLKIELFCYFWILFIPCVLHIITFYQIYLLQIFFLFCDLSLYYLNNIFHWAESFNESRKSVISFTEHVIIVSKVFNQTSEFPDSILLRMSWSFLHLPLWLVIANICVFVSSPFIKRT